MGGGRAAAGLWRPAGPPDQGIIWYEIGSV